VRFELTEVKCPSGIRLIVVSWTSPGFCVTVKHTVVDVPRRALFQAAHYEVHFERYFKFQTYVINSPTRWLNSKRSLRSFRYRAIFRKRFSQRRIFHISSTSCDRNEASFKRSIWIDSCQADSITNREHNTHIEHLTVDVALLFYGISSRAKWLLRHPVYAVLITRFRVLFFYIYDFSKIALFYHILVWFIIAQHTASCHRLYEMITTTIQITNVF